MLSKEFEVVKTQVVANIDFNDEKFKKIDEQMMKGANDRKGRIVDRKTFHSSISNFSGSEGEPEIRGFAFQLRRFLSKDDHYLDMMAWLEGLEGEFTKEIADAHRTKMKEWQFDEMDQQFYQILVATAVPKSVAAHKLMALEKRKGVPRGMMAYHDFTRELLGSTVSTRTMIANRVRNPAPITSVDDIEVRMLQWKRTWSSSRVTRKSWVRRSRWEFSRTWSQRRSGRSSASRNPTRSTSSNRSSKTKRRSIGTSRRRRS